MNGTALESRLNIVSPPISGYSDFGKPSVLYTDASQEGVGAVLYQKQVGKMDMDWIWLTITNRDRKELFPPLWKA